MSTVSSDHRESMRRLQRLAFLVSLAPLSLCIIGAFFRPAQFFRAYLTAYQFYLGIALGSMVLVMLYHLTGGAWGFLIRRILEAGMRTLPLLAVLFLPIAGGVGYLYLWARPEEVAADKDLQWKHIYLNVPFFWCRAVLFFFLWLVFAWLLHAWSRRQDQRGGPEWADRLGRLSAPGLVVYGVSITFASIDWVMSLQPSFRSSIFGPLFASGHLLSAQAFALIVLTYLASRPPLNEAISLEALNDLGNLLLTFLIIWAYMVWFQFMLVWIANLRYDIIWYLPRSEGGWQYVAWALAVLHLFVPFFLLLMRDIKRDPSLLRMVAGLILFMQLVFMNYQILPAFEGTTLADHWMDFLMPVGLGGLWLSYFLWGLGRTPLLPLHDANEGAALHLRHLDLEELARMEEASHA